MDLTIPLVRWQSFGRELRDQITNWAYDISREPRRPDDILATRFKAFGLRLYVGQQI
jgi:hypothetical protein